MDFVLLLFGVLIVLQRGVADLPPLVNDQAYQDGELGAYPRQTFFSDLDVIAPVPNIIVQQKDGASPARYITWAAHSDNFTTVPQLLDVETLSVIYQGPHYDEDTFGFTVQTCNDTDYLIWWAGTSIDGRAGGFVYILNSTYHLVWNISSIDLEYIDAHDVFLTPDCHAIYTSYQSRVADLQEYGSEIWPLSNSSWLLDSYFEEVDLLTNELVFRWRASGHIDMHDSFWLPEIEQQGDENWHGWDFFHINSVQKDHLGNYLISARHTNAVYYIEGRTGSVLWTLGGSRNDFVDLSGGRATDFSWQHDARWIDDSLTSLSLFDDRSCGYIQAEDPTSRGIIIDLDFDAMTVSLAAEYRAPDDIVAVRKGGMHHLDNGNNLLGYGSEPAFTEFAHNGTILWDVRFGPVMQDIDRETADNYRAYKLDWDGTPHWSPKIAAGPSVDRMPVTLFNGAYTEPLSKSSNDTAYFSWNGATRLTSWLVLAADEPRNVLEMRNVLAQIDKTGFETGLYVGEQFPFICVIAMDNEDKILGVSQLLHVPSGKTAEIEDTASPLYSQYVVFKQKWHSHKYLNARLNLAIPVMAVSGIVLVFCACYKSRALSRRLADVFGRRGYQPVQHMDEIEKQLDFDITREFSTSSAVDPATSLMSHETVKWESEDDPGVGARRIHQ